MSTEEIIASDKEFVLKYNPVSYDAQLAKTFISIRRLVKKVKTFEIQKIIKKIKFFRTKLNQNDPKNVQENREKLILKLEAELSLMKGLDNAIIGAGIFNGLKRELHQTSLNTKNHHERDIEDSNIVSEKLSNSTHNSVLEIRMIERIKSSKLISTALNTFKDSSYSATKKSNISKFDNVAQKRKREKDKKESFNNQPQLSTQAQSESSSKNKISKSKPSDLEPYILVESDQEVYSDYSEVEEYCEKKKNRPGQRARKEIWEKLYGDKANHKRNEKIKKKEELKKKTTVRVEKKIIEKRTIANIHPSWEAKKKQAKGIVEFKGSKIVFE